MSLALILFGAVFLFYGAIPLVFYRIFHPGVLTFLLTGTIFLLFGWFWNRPFLAKRPKYQKIFLGLCSAGLAATALFLIPMVHQAYFSPPAQEGPVTVVVLGCQIRGDEPSLMLRRRLDAACRYLERNPQAAAVLSGGYGEGLLYSEAYVMERYLLSRGIAPERLYQENRSHNTRTNLEYSAQVIQEHGLPQQVVIATDGFHQLRGTIYARRAGLTVAGSCPSATPWGLAPTYWVREFYALIVSLVSAQ